MTDDEDQEREPTPEERAAFGAAILRAQAIAHRWLAALNCGDHQGVNAAMVDTHKTGYGMHVTNAMACMVLELGRQLYGPQGLQQRLDNDAMLALDIAQKTHERGDT